MTQIRSKKITAKKKKNNNKQRNRKKKAKKNIKEPKIMKNTKSKIEQKQSESKSFPLPAV